MERNIIKGQNIPLPQESYGCLLYNSLRNGKSNVAMIDAGTGVETTYEELLQYTISLAQHLKELGVTSSDSIAVCSANSLYFTITVVASLYIGVPIAAVNHLYTPRELIHALKISQPKIIFCSYSTLDKIMETSKEIESVQKIVVLDKSTDLPSSVQSLEEYLHYPCTASFEVTPVEVDHVATIMFSSGTTGVAKGVMLTHKNLNASYIMCKHPVFVGFNSRGIGLALPPYYHTFGFVIHLHMLALHMKMVVMPRFEPHMFLNAIQLYRITSLCLVPPLILFLGKHPLVEKYDLSSIDDVICGASPLSSDIQEIAIKRLGINSIRQGYGLTETTAGALVTPKCGNKYGSVGLPAPNVELKVRDVTTNRTLGPNQQGELCLRGPLIMKGYVNNPETTSETIDSEGWLLTGDAAYYDTDDYVYIVDRYKELIKYNGYQVPPAEIEAILLAHPQIQDCGVIGKPDTAKGELPVAFIVKQGNATISEKDIINFVAENVSYHKRLHGGVRFVKEIPKSPMGKILRRILKDQL